MVLRPQLRVVRRSNGINHRPKPRSDMHLELQKSLVVPVTERCSLFGLSSMSVLDNFRYYGITHGISRVSVRPCQFILWREQFSGEKECESQEVKGGIIIPASDLLFTREIAVAWQGRQVIFVNPCFNQDARDAIRLFVAKPSVSFVQTVTVLKRFAA